MVGVTDQKTRFVVKVITIKQLEVKVLCFFSVCDILTAVATCLDVYISRFVDSELGVNKHNNNDRWTDRSLYNLHMHVG